MENTEVKKSKSPIVLGILSLIAWLLPIIGAPVSISGIVIACKKIKAEKTTSAKIGLVLSILGLILTIGNAALGIKMRMNK